MSSPSQADKEHFLGLAMAEAIRGCQAGQGGPFGAVVVKDGVVIARAANAAVANNDPTAHAEVRAIRAACAALASFQLVGCDIYASCEPCPMCMGAILWARLRALYYGATRHSAAAAGFDDLTFHRELDRCEANEGTCLVLHEQVTCPGVENPFLAYAALPVKVHY